MDNSHAANSRKNRPNIALVLGGGGALGFAHIGVLRTLERHGIKPDLVVGTSIGAILGGLYCSGISVDELDDIAHNFNWKMFTKLFLPSFSRTGFIKGDNILRFFRELVGDREIEKLPVKFAAVTFDMIRQQECVLTSGDLAYAMMASMSIPLVFPPLRYGEREFVDGGAVNPLPVNVARELGARHVIAVNVLKKNPFEEDRCFMGIEPSHYEEEKKARFRSVEERLESVMLNKVVFSRENKKFWSERFMTMYQFFDQYNPEKSNLTITQILVRIFYASQYYITLLHNDPDIDLLIEPDVHDIGMFSFHEAHVLVGRGEELAEKLLVKSPLSAIMKS